LLAVVAVVDSDGAPVTAEGPSPFTSGLVVKVNAGREVSPYVPKALFAVTVSTAG
jgi:hypothetical protein